MHWEAGRPVWLHQLVIILISPEMIIPPLGQVCCEDQTELCKEKPLETAGYFAFKYYPLRLLCLGGRDVGETPVLVT